MRGISARGWEGEGIRGTQGRLPGQTERALVAGGVIGEEGRGRGEFGVAGQGLSTEVMEGGANVGVEGTVQRDVEQLTSGAVQGGAREEKGQGKGALGVTRGAGQGLSVGVVQGGADVGDGEEQMTVGSRLRGAECELVWQVGADWELALGADDGMEGTLGMTEQCVAAEGQQGEVERGITAREKKGGGRQVKADVEVTARPRHDLPAVTDQRLSARAKHERAGRLEARTAVGTGSGGEGLETRQKGTGATGSRTSPESWRGIPPGSGQGDDRSSTKHKARSHRREESEGRHRLKARLGGTRAEYSPSPASRGGSCHREKPDYREGRSSTKVGSQQEKKGVQKKVECRRQKKQVTVDSSKAKTSLEALKISIQELRWKEFPLGRRAPCDIYWHGVSFHESENISSGQVNKFPGMTEMVRKINFSRAVRTMQELFPEEYNFYPQSWILPEEFHLFNAQVRMAKEKDPLWKPTFIVKPDGGCQGDGIYLIKDPAEIRAMGVLQNRPAIVQEYMSRPLLIDKLKFDIRLYVLLRSLEPLEMYVAKEGLSRFCTEPYQEPTHKNLHKVYMHLTNYSLNVHSGNFVHSDSAHTGSKRTFSSILYRLAAKGADVRKVWSDVIALVIKTVIALTPELKVYYQADIPPGKPGPTCFQILGFDILLLKSLKPVLLEVNANPSMKIEHEQELLPGMFENVPSVVDEGVKIAVIRDTLRLIDPGTRKNSHSPSSPSDTTKKELLTGTIDQAEPEINQRSESNLPSLCLKQVFPKYAKHFNYLRLVERMSSVFVRFLGIKGTMKLGATGFRTFIRSCKLSSGSFSMASVDILYIDITRRWNSMCLDQRESGMCLQAFVEAFFYLAQRRFKGLPLRQQVESLLNLCESHLESVDEKRLPCSRGHAGQKTALSSVRRADLNVTSYPPLFSHASTSCKLTDYKLQHS